MKSHASTSSTRGNSRPNGKSEKWRREKRTWRNLPQVSSPTFIAPHGFHSSPHLTLKTKSSRWDTYRLNFLSELIRISRSVMACEITMWSNGSLWSLAMCRFFKVFICLSPKGKTSNENWSIRMRSMASIVLCFERILPMR